MSLDCHLLAKRHASVIPKAGLIWLADPNLLLHSEVCDESHKGILSFLKEMHKRPFSVRSTL